ncbi:MAG: hypothetical protein ABW136_05510, partial [Steroidobacteraceae bacterium]
MAAGRSLKRLGAFAAAAAALVPLTVCAAAEDPVLDAARAIRLEGCGGRPGIRAELHRDADLD